MSEKEVSPGIFAAVWQTSKSAAEVAHKLGISLSEANKMAKAFSRANGLMPHPPRAPTKSQGMRAANFQGHIVATTNLDYANELCEDWYWLFATHGGPDGEITYILCRLRNKRKSRD